jgi:aspartyl aminopeptidase
MLSVDIGLPQLAMHSNYEVCGASDVEDMIKLIKKFYETKVIVKESNVLFK